MNASNLTLHEDTFYEYFKPYRHPNASYDIWGDLGLETFGLDLQLTYSLQKENVWSVLDGEGSDQCIVPGLQTVNRVYYLVTEIPHD